MSDRKQLSKSTSKKNVNLTSSVKSNMDGDDEEDQSLEDYVIRFRGNNIHKSNYSDPSNLFDESPSKPIRILITGSSSDVGQALIMNFAKHPMRNVLYLYLVGHDESILKRLNEILTSVGIKSKYLVEEYEFDIKTAASNALEFLDGCIDIFLLQDIYSFSFQKFEHTPPEDFTAVLSMVKRMFLWLTEVLKTFRQRNSGQIIVSSSILGMEYQAGCAAYCTGQSAIQGMIGTMRKEFEGTKVKITNVLSDTVSCDFTKKTQSSELERIKPEEIAKTIRLVIDQGLGNVEQIVLKPPKRTL